MPLVCYTNEYTRVFDSRVGFEPGSYVCLYMPGVLLNSLILIRKDMDSDDIFQIGKSCIFIGLDTAKIDSAKRITPEYNYR